MNRPWFEVFNYVTGETVGYTQSKLEVGRRLLADPTLDYICADDEASDYTPAF